MYVGVQERRAQLHSALFIRATLASPPPPCSMASLQLSQHNLDKFVKENVTGDIVSTMCIEEPRALKLGKRFTLAIHRELALPQGKSEGLATVGGGSIGVGI